MTNCQYCGAQNIDGADLCDSCQQPLDYLADRSPLSDVERSLLRDQVRMIQSRRPVIVEPSRPVGEVLDLLVSESIGCVVVVDRDDQLVGIFSERDALIRLNADAREMENLPISQFMTPSPETIDSKAVTAFALHKMDLGGYRHLPVTGDDGKIVGILSIRDILRYITTHLAASS